jgi:hypothetical protein
VSRTSQRRGARNQSQGGSWQTIAAGTPVYVVWNVGVVFFVWNMEYKDLHGVAHVMNMDVAPGTSYCMCM